MSYILDAIATAIIFAAFGAAMIVAVPDSHPKLQHRIISTR